jgi:hypothetical protein
MRTPWWNTRVGRATITSVGVFALLVAGGFAGMRRVPALGFARQEVPPLRQPDPGWAPVFFRGGQHLDHTIFWHAIGPSIEHARRADVLFVGSSTMQFAIPPHELRAFEKRSRVRAFSLGMPGEAYPFALDLIGKFGLRPRVVVASFDSLRPFRSAEAVRVQATSHWTALTTVWEERLAAIVWPAASRLLPRFGTRRPTFALLRSSRNGTWMPLRWPNARYTGTNPQALKWHVRHARIFRDALAARGAQLVIVCIPTRRIVCTPEALRPLAEYLRVPMVVPRVDWPLTFSDLVHLSALDGKRFGRALLRDLGRLGVVRGLPSRRTGAPGAVGRRDETGSGPIGRRAAAMVRHGGG